jgi:hypothetical protein
MAPFLPPPVRPEPVEERVTLPESGLWRKAVNGLFLDLDSAGVTAFQEERYDTMILLRGDLELFADKASALESAYSDALGFLSRAADAAVGEFWRVVKTYRENGRTYISEPRDEDSLEYLSEMVDIDLTPGLYDMQMLAADVAGNIRTPYVPEEITAATAKVLEAAAAVLALTDEFDELAGRTSSLIEE